MAEWSIFYWHITEILSPEKMAVSKGKGAEFLCGKIAIHTLKW